MLFGGDKGLIKQRLDVAVILELDRDYREQAAAGELPLGELPGKQSRLLPVLTRQYEGWRLTALRKDQSDKVTVYCRHPRHANVQRAFVRTAKIGSVAGKRVVRSRHAECADYYRQLSPAATKEVPEEPVAIPPPDIPAAPQGRSSSDAPSDVPRPLPVIRARLSTLKDVCAAWGYRHRQAAAVVGVFALTVSVAVFVGDHDKPGPPAQDNSRVVGSMAATPRAESFADSSGASDATLQLANGGAATPPASRGEKKGDLSISGRILTQTGEPVPNIGATARSLSPGGSARQSAGSNRAGIYKISGLTAGEYRVQTIASDRYPSATIIARAGLRSADIVLAESHGAEVFGTVTDKAGKALKGVEVISNAATKPARTDDAGNYSVSLNAQANRSYFLRYSLAGYESEQIGVSGKELLEAGEKRVDTQLAAAGKTTEVRGLVHNELGKPIAGARVSIHSPGTTAYQGVSDQRGEFAIANVKVGSDYQLKVQSTGLYEHYIGQPLTIRVDQPLLEIRLKSLDAGRLAGNMVDVYGNPVPNFTLALSSSKAMSRSLQVTGDDLGHFEVDGVPEGQLIFTTRSDPSMQVRGVLLPPGKDVSANLVLDWGHESIAGKVVDQVGRPVAGARVSFSWAHAQGGMHSRSIRQTMTDGLGAFRFTQLGPGVHTLAASRQGYRPARENYDVGRESGPIVLRLNPR